MRRYEAMFILRPDLNESERADTFNQIKEIFGKFKTKIIKADVWAEKRKLYFNLTLKGKGLKFSEGLYYLVEFESVPTEIKNITETLRIKEDILRFFITAKGE
ncbi:MAG: 30S ribosomal protein S6 [Candidatus Omnitrophica bacterium]|nr:30S ribosomal protein S6 [Candidatus Omnitrophota bacterium]MDD5356109.1 30S ribosomal protein S6 [Candidatus Omnitrophota bacterium]